MVPQRAVLFKGTLRDNMRWGKEDASDEEIWHALDVAQARDFVEAKGEGLDLVIDQAATTYPAANASVLLLQGHW